MLTLSRKIIISLLITLFFSLTSCATQEKHEDNLNWLTSYDKAVEIAKKENKPILIDFTGSDWCKWCFKLTDDIFSKEAFKKYADKELVLLSVDFPKGKQQTPVVKIFNNNLAKKFGVRGFPTIIMIDKNEKILGKTGYRQGGVKPYIEHLKAMY